MRMPSTRLKTSCVAFVVFLGLVSSASGPPAAHTARGDGPQTDAPGPAPRLPNGKPDLSGTWQRPYVPNMTSERPNHQGIPELPFTAWGLDSWTNYDPVEGDYTGNCFPFGLSRSINGPFPMQIMHDETHLALLFELGNWFHLIPLDGRDHPEEVDPSWYGHSVGRWEADTIVVDTIGFNGYTRLDTAGHPHTDELHLVQTFERVDATHIEYTMTVDDPKAYTAPWTNARVFTPFDGDLMEYVCMENNRALWEGRIKPWTPPWR